MFDNEFPPLGGGTGVVNLHLFEELSGYPDVTVDLVTSSRTRATEECEQFSERITLYKVPVHNRNIHHATNSELLRYTFRGHARARKLLRGRPYDLSFAFSGVPAGGISYALHRNNGLPYVLSLQGPDVPGFEKRYAPLYPFLKPVLRQIWKRAGAVIAISEAHRSLAHAFLPAQEVRVIHNGVDGRTFFPRTMEKGDDSVEVVCVGRLIERKGQHHLMRAFASLDPAIRSRARLCFVGTGDAEPSLHRLAADLRISTSVVFKGFVGREAMPAVYHRADIFVLPSQSEGMSMALLEAMASGLPVVVTDTGGASELIREGVNGFVVPWGDEPGLRSVLSRLIPDQERRASMGAAARTKAEEFTWSSITREYLDVCEGVIEKTGARSMPQ